MKKLAAVLALAAILASMLGTTAFAAGSASVTITNTTSVQQGKSYTYTISVKITSSMDFIGKIEFSGIFSHDPIYLDFHPSSNSGKTLSSKVTFKIPSGAKIGDTGKITVSGDGDYMDDASKVVEYHVGKSLTAKVIAPVATKPPSATAKPSTATRKPSSVMATARATAAPTPSEWDLAAQSVAALASGGTAAVDVDAAQSSKMPVTLLSALKERQARLSVNLGGYSCTIDGASLGNIPSAESIDLAMTMEKDAALSAACGGADAYQMHFAYAGQLPGKFTYTFKAEGSKPGDTLYLYYYYDQPGVLEGLQTAVVADDGSVSFDIYHCSSYIVSAGVIANAAGSLAGAEAERQAALDARQKAADLEAQLKAAQDGAAQLQSQLDQQSNELRAAQDKAAQLENQPKAAPAAAEAPAGPAPAPGFSVRLSVLVEAVFGAVLLSVFLTMLICRAGLFKRKERE